MILRENDSFLGKYDEELGTFTVRSVSSYII